MQRISIQCNLHFRSYASEPFHSWGKGLNSISSSFFPAFTFAAAIAQQVLSATRSPREVCMKRLTEHDEVHPGPFICLIDPSMDRSTLHDDIAGLQNNALVVIESQRERSADQNAVVD